MKIMAFMLQAFLLFAWPSCQPAKTEQAAEEPCPEDTMCTQVFSSVSISLTNQEGQPVALESYTSKNETTGKVYQLQEDFPDLPQETGSYPIITDGQLKELKKAGTPITFTGMKGGKVVVQEQYVIGHDCCHVVLISGKRDLKIE